MQVSFHKYYIQIQSAKACDLIALVNNQKIVNAGAFYPFLFLRYNEHPMNEQWIILERIHFAQQIELFFIFFWLIYYGEIIYNRLIRGDNLSQAYLNSSFEQECYINQSNSNYLNRRKAYSWKDHIKEKKMVEFVGNSKVEITQSVFPNSKSPPKM